MARILLVDDDKDLNNLLKYVVEMTDHKVIAQAINGLEAVELFLKHLDEIDLVIMDHRMTVIDGVNATKKILEIKHDTKVLFISADETVQEEALQAGSVHFLLKPFSYDEFISIINKYVED